MKVLNSPYGAIVSGNDLLIHRIELCLFQPVCNVQSWVSIGEAEKTQAEASVYRVSFQDRPAVPVHIIHKEDKDKPIEGIG